MDDGCISPITFNREINAEYDTGFVNRKHRATTVSIMYRSVMRKRKDHDAIKV